MKSIGLQLANTQERDMTVQLMNEQMFPSLKQEQDLQDVVILDLDDKGVMALLSFGGSGSLDLGQSDVLSKILSEKLVSEGVDVKPESIIERPHNILN